MHLHNVYTSNKQNWNRRSSTKLCLIYKTLIRSLPLQILLKCLKMKVKNKYYFLKSIFEYLNNNCCEFILIKHSNLTFCIWGDITLYIYLRYLRNFKILCTEACLAMESLVIDKLDKIDAEHLGLTKLHSDMISALELYNKYVPM